MSLKNQSVVTKLIPTTQPDTIDGNGFVLLLDFPRDIYWKIVEVSAKEHKHPDEFAAEWIIEKIQKVIQSETTSTSKRRTSSNKK